MANELGLSFQPGSQGFGAAGEQNKQRSVPPVQEAVRLLSLRLPSVVGARALAPLDILSQGSGGTSALAEGLGMPSSERLATSFGATSQKRDLMDLVFKLYAGGSGSRKLSVTGGTPNRPLRRPYGVAVQAGVAGVVPPPVSTKLPQPAAPAPRLAVPRPAAPSPRVDQYEQTPHEQYGGYPGGYYDQDSEYHRG
jgi:hypothetical protein